MMLVKISILLLYLRLFGAGSATTRRLIYGGGAAVTLFYTAFVALQLALCLPRRGESAGSSGTTRRCHGSWKPRYFAFSAFSIASDVYIVALPVRVVWRLHMDRRRKIAVTALFVMGLLCVTFLLLPHPSPPPPLPPCGPMSLSFPLPSFLCFHLSLRQVSRPSAFHLSSGSLESGARY